MTKLFPPMSGVLKLYLSSRFKIRGTPTLAPYSPLDIGHLVPILTNSHIVSASKSNVKWTVHLSFRVLLFILTYLFLKLDVPRKAIFGNEDIKLYLIGHGVSTSCFTSLRYVDIALILFSIFSNSNIRFYLTRKCTQNVEQPLGNY